MIEGLRPPCVKRWQSGGPFRVQHDGEWASKRINWSLTICSSWDSVAFFICSYAQVCFHESMRELTSRNAHGWTVLWSTSAHWWTVLHSIYAHRWTMLYTCIVNELCYTHLSTSMSCAIHIYLHQWTVLYRCMKEPVTTIPPLRFNLTSFRR
jgi:hypothetical protein